MAGDTTADDSRLTRRQRHVAIAFAVVFLALTGAAIVAAQSGTDGFTTGGYDLSNASIQHTTDSQESFPEGMAWNDKGTMLYEAGNGNIYTYTVSDPWNVSTATLSDTTSINSQEPGIVWANNGTQMFIADFNGGEIDTYTVSTPYDVSTATLTSEDSVVPQITGIAWANEGRVLYVSEIDNDTVRQYAVSTPYDVSSISFEANISAQQDIPVSVTVSDTGDRLFVTEQTGGSGGDAYQYNLSESYNISTATLAESLNVNDEAEGMAWGQDGRYLYTIGSTSAGNPGYIEQYVITSAEFNPNEGLKIRANNYMRPNTSQVYEIVNRDGDPVPNATLSSSDNVTLTVYESNNTLVATSNRNRLPSEVTITAEEEGETDSKNVTVAKPSVENLDLLPTWWKVNATVGDGMMLWLIVATLAAVVATRAATSFAGVGAYVMIMIAGWITGSVSDGVMVAVILTGLFLGMNLAANVDTTIRGSG